MWIFTTQGFISAVYKDNAVQIRARDKKSLTQLSAHSGATITHTPLADYPYRLATSRELFAAWLANQAQVLGYPNFKSEVELVRGSKFVRPLHKVWSAMLDIEDEGARK